MMRITFVNRMMGIQRGGGEYFDLQMGRTLRLLGHEVSFVVGRRLSRLDLPLEEFETVYLRTPYLRGVEYRQGKSGGRLLGGAGTRLRRLDDYLFAQAALRFLRKAGDAEVYQVCALSFLAAKLTDCGLKAVVRWPGPPGEKAARYARRAAASFSHGKSYEGAKVFLPDTQCIVAGCDQDLFRPPENRERGIGQCGFVFVGRCVPVKNLEFLIEGFAEARRARPAITLTIVGDGEMLPSLKRVSSGLLLGDAVQFKGALAGEELASSYRQADCFVLVSTYESFSLVCLEAMSSGLPLILSRVGHLPTFVEKYGAGTLVEPGDVRGLAEAMIWWADHPESRRTTGLRNRRVIEESYSWESSARRLVSLYESIVRPTTQTSSIAGC
jgi:glycosyltransferase involved in cell wall biosynthesis